MQTHQNSTVLEVVQEYVRRGWAVVPLNGKRPVYRNWTGLRLTHEDLPKHFARDENVGVLLGTASGNLVDVDVDHPAAIRLADRLLPPTGAVFGRASKPGSHRFYRISGPLPQTKRWVGPDGEVLLELRSTKAQTMFPPSIHPESGEVVAWERFEEPGEVTAEELVEACSRLAAATLLALAWPPRGSRHDTSLALSGFLLRRGWAEEEAAEFVRAVAEAANDEEVADRVRSTVTTARRLLEGGAATGLPTLKKQLGEEVVRKLEEWLAGGPQGGFWSFRSFRSFRSYGRSTSYKLKPPPSYPQRP